MTTAIYVKKTMPDSVRVFTLVDVLRDGLDAAAPVWTAYRTKKAMREAVDMYTDCDGYTYDKAGRVRAVSRSLCEDVAVWIGDNANIGEYYSECCPFPKSRMNRFESVFMSTAYEIATYGDGWTLMHDNETETAYVRSRDETYDGETAFPLDAIPEYRPAVAQFEESTGYRFNKAMSGKMSGIMCASTSCLCNPFCAARRNNPDMICPECFAVGTCHQYDALSINMARNTEIITSRLFEEWELPVLPGPLFRFESFGDLQNVTQARNYIRMARVNPNVACALWTKNPGFLAQAVALEGGRPDNLVTILSSAYKDIPVPLDRFPGLFDKRFTVYRPETVAARGIDINCGARDCMTCRRCYSRTTESDIRELLK